MSFHEVRFPAALSVGSSGGPERRTEIVTLSNGFEERNSPWAQSRRRYDAGLGDANCGFDTNRAGFFGEGTVASGRSGGRMVPSKSSCADLPRR